MKDQDTQYLEINKLEANPRLNRLLPRELACRYNALPVAGDGHNITVAMANPNDRIAREGVIGFLGASACVVRADIQVIEGLLDAFWKKESTSSLELLYWTHSQVFSDQVGAYASMLANMLGAHINQFETSKTSDEAVAEFLSELEQINANLVILGEVEQSILERLIERHPDDKQARQLPTSILVFRQPCWPIKNILLVLRSDAINETAVDWCICLACSSGARVTILPLILPVEVTNDQNPLMCSCADTYLSVDSPQGVKLRSVAQRLVNSEISGTMRLRQESPTWQIRFELLENDYDLVIIDYEPPERLWHWILAEIVNPLFCWTDKPVLITKPFTRQVI